MSYYDSETEIYEDEQEKDRNLFRYDNSLLRSADALLQDWKPKLGLPIIDYLKKQATIVAKQYELLACGAQIRALAFCSSLKKCFEQLIQKYSKTYKAYNQDDETKLSSWTLEIKQLDLQLETVVRYLMLLEANNILNAYEQLQQESVANIYTNLRKVADYCLDLNTLWITLLAPRMFREEQKEDIYKVNYGGTLLYYEKQLTYLLDRIKRSEVKNFIIRPNNQRQYLTTIAKIVNNEKLKSHLKTKIISLLKGQYFVMKKQKTLKEQFILSSFQMYHGEQVSQLWDYERYEDLCIQTLKKSFHDSSYLDCTLYMQPENIDFERRKKTIQFAEIYNSIIQKIVHLRQQKQINEKKVQKAIQIPLTFLHNISSHYNIQLLGHLYVNFLISNKNAFSINSPQLDKLLFGILQNLRQIYLSFGTTQWIAPTSIISALTSKFFSKFSQNIKNQIVSRLPVMVQYLGGDKLPTLPVVTCQNNTCKVQLREISKSQYLVAMFCYIRDAEYKDEDFYLDLPQVPPSSFESAIMFIKSLQLKLKHHQPTQDQKKMWTMIIEASVNHYKIKVDLKWYKPQRRLDVKQRQNEYAIHRQIKNKWAFNILQKALNFRDLQRYEQLAGSAAMGEISLQNDLIQYYKYAIGIKITASRFNSIIQQYDIFMLLDKMRALLEINYGNIIDLQPDQLVTLNQLHLCLQFYNTKVQQAKGNQNYALIVHKIVIPWLQANDSKACQNFKQMFPSFFTNFIIRDFYLLLGDSLISLFCNETVTKQNLMMKIQFYTELLHQQTLVSMPLDNNAEFLQKLFSVITQTIDMDVLLLVFLLTFKFIQCQHQLQDNYISLGFLIDFISQPTTFTKFIQKIQQLEMHQYSRIINQIVKKLPQIFNQLTLTHINHILQGYVDSQFDTNPQKLLSILDSIPQQKTNLVLAILKAFFVEENRQKGANNGLDAAAQKQLQNKTANYWRKLQKYVDTYGVEKKNDEEQVDLNKVTSTFEETVLKKLQEDYKKLLLQNKKKRSSKKKSLKDKKMGEGEKKQDEGSKKQIQDDDKLMQAKIWRKVVRNFGTFEDIILFGEDPIELLGTNNDQQLYNDCIKVIKQRNIQHKYLKRIIRKLPILQKCAEDIVKQLQQKNNKGQEVIQPELLCKLILINSRYKSHIIQQFILRNISVVPIPIKIYQDYLVLDIKKKLQNLPKDSINKMIYDDIGTQNMRKINQIFDLLVYMPIKKFQHIYLKFQQKIQEKAQGENQEWQTESEKDDNEQQEEEDQETNTKQKIAKKKSQKKQQGNQQKKEQQNENDYQDIQDNQQNEDDDGQSYQDGDESNMEQEQNEKPKIVDMFYQQGNSNLIKYKETIQIREQLDIDFGENYLNYQNLQKKIKQSPEMEKKLFRLVDILQNGINEQEVTIEILNKMPINLYKLLKNYGLTKERNQEQIQKYRKQVTKMPRFIKEYMSDRDENSVHDEGQDDYEQQIYEQADDLSEQTGSVDDLFDGNDGMLFIVGEDGQLAQIDAGQLLKQQQEDQEQEQQRQIQEIQIQQKLSQDANDVLSLPQLKQINSKIEAQLTGKQLGQQQMVKIIQIAIIKLFSLHIYQLKHKPVLSFYKQLINSKQGKIFIDTLFTVLRVDQNFQDIDRFNLAKKLSKLQLAIPKALNNILQIAYDISTEDSKQGKQFDKTLVKEVEQLLPIGDQIMVKSNIPIQDNYLTLLIFYSRYSQRNIHDKIKKLLGSFNEDQAQAYELNKAKAALLTKHIYKNSNSSSIWNTLQEMFGVKIQMKTKFTSCLTVYGKLLREDVQKCYNDLLNIVKQEIPADEEMSKQKKNSLIKQQEKKVQQNLRKHFKRIKHYYYWNKRNIISQIDKLETKPLKMLKDKELIKLTQLMIFYCHFLKQKFFQKIDEKAMKNLLVLPKSIIQTSFMFLWKLQAKIDKWQSLNKVKQYFKTYKLYEHKFERLQQVCNLILQFLEMPQFSNSKFKQVIIPYFINHPDIAHQIPLIFKLPDIPQQLNGQQLYLTRECSFDMAFYQLMAPSFLIEFHNEEGSDHGGMVRQLMMGWHGVGIGEQHIFIGKILAFSFKKSIPYGGKFDIAMAVAITQFKVTIQFLQQVQPDVAQSLKYIKESDPQDLDVKFEITKQQLGIIKHYPLIQNGQNIAVTNENKQQYIQLFLAKYYLVGREWEMSQLCAGFYSTVNKKYASIFHPLEMIQKIQGEQISDYKKLKDRTKYEEGYTESSQMIKWFWEIVSQFNQKQMNKFLQFITGAPKVSIYNHNFSFVIEKPYADVQARLPVAHTCFTTLQLPQYKTKQTLQKKLRQAIFEGNDSFGIM